MSLGRLISPRIRDGVAYNAYLRARYPEHFAKKLQELRFYANVLKLAGRRDLIFDIGANNGNKTVIFSRISDRVISIEPSPACCEAMRRRFARTSNISVMETAVGAECGYANLHMFDEADCYNTLSGKWLEALVNDNDRLPRRHLHTTLSVAVTTIETLLKLHGVPAYIKIDVEGHELGVLQGLRRPVPMLSLECNLPEFEDETIKAVALLKSRDPEAAFNYTIGDEFVFASGGWLSDGEMIEIIKTDRLRYMEIYCRSAN
jgi:FkbM family methyltransferase